MSKCSRRETYKVSLSLPNGFTTDSPSFSVTLRPGESQLKTANITSPTAINDGDYPVAATASSTALSGTGTSYYKVYSSDTVAPTFYWMSPANGAAVTGNVDLSNNARDDHMARKIKLYIDGILVNTQTNAGIVNDVSMRHTWDTRGLSKDQHTILYKAYDDLNNISTNSATYTVQ